MWLPGKNNMFDGMPVWLVLIIGVILFGSVFLTITQPRDRNLFKNFLEQNGYQDVQVSSVDTGFVCENRAGIKIMGSARFVALKDSSLRNIHVCYSKESAYYYDAKELPARPIVLTKESAYKGYQNNPEAMKIIESEGFYPAF